MSKYYRLVCTTEQKFKYVWSDTPPTVCPTDPTHTIDTNTIIDMEVDFAYHEYALPARIVWSTTYQTVFKFIFYGIKSDEIYRDINAITRSNYWNSNTTTTYDIRIYDITNNKVIIEKTGLTNGTDQIVNLGIPNNALLPTTTAMFELQMKRGTGYNYPMASFLSFKYAYNVEK